MGGNDEDWKNPQVGVHIFLIVQTELTVNSQGEESKETTQMEMGCVLKSLRHDFSMPL